MAMQSGAVPVTDKFPALWYNQQQQLVQHQMDERELFNMWLRGEFAAANAIIDALCHHLRMVGDLGEYDGVIGCIQQRRYTWNPILNMQQYFSVAEVIHALQLVGSRRQQSKEVRNGGRVQVQVQQNGKDLKNPYVKTSLVDGGSEKRNVDDKIKTKEVNGKPEADSLTKKQGSTQGAVTYNEHKEEDKGEPAGSCNVNASGYLDKEKPNHEVTPKTFVAMEKCDGKLVNVVEGMKVYEELIDSSKISKLNTLVNDLRAAGRRGKLQGPTYVVSKRPMNGHGREKIQFGISSADTPPYVEATFGTSKDLKAEPIPGLFQDVIERLLAEQVVTAKPDSCIIDIFDEGDHLQPHMLPQRFGRPVCILFLTECDMSFGKVISTDPGVYRGALKLSFSPGSMLVMQGRSADFARYAIPSLPKQRIIITFVKSQPRKISNGELHRFPSSNLVAHPSRPTNHIRPVAPEHFSVIPPASVLPVVVPGISFATPVAASPGWAAAPPRPTRVPVPGTGVFLPHQTCANSLKHTSSTTLATENSSSSDVNGQVKELESNGKVDEAKGGTVVAEELTQS